MGNGGPLIWRRQQRLPLNPDPGNIWATSGPSRSSFHPSFSWWVPAGYPQQLWSWYFAVGFWKPWLVSTHCSTLLRRATPGQHGIVLFPPIIRGPIGGCILPQRMQMSRYPPPPPRRAEWHPLPPLIEDPAVGHAPSLTVLPQQRPGVEHPRGTSCPACMLDHSELPPNPRAAGPFFP